MNRGGQYNPFDAPSSAPIFDPFASYQPVRGGVSSNPFPQPHLTSYPVVNPVAPNTAFVDESRNLRMLLDQANQTISTLREELAKAKRELDKLKITNATGAATNLFSSNRGGDASNFDDFFGSIAPKVPEMPSSPTGKMLRRASFLNQKGIFASLLSTRDLATLLPDRVVYFLL